MTTVYWLEQTGTDVPASDDWLSPIESIRLQGMRFAKRRADWRLGRWTAKRTVAAFLDTADGPSAFRDIEIRSAPCGAPEVFIGCQPAGVTISISHRAGVAACAMASRDVALGCDLEIIEPRSDVFVSEYFTPDEQALVARAPATVRTRLVALLWSAKESALKALGVGLRFDTRSVRVTPFDVSAQNVWCPLTVRHVSGRVFAAWWKCTDDLLRTLVATPPPTPPRILKLCTAPGL